MASSQYPAAMPRTKRSTLPPVIVGIARSRRREVRRTPNGGWAWSCCLCRAYAELEDAAQHKLCLSYALLDTATLREHLITAYRERMGKVPRHTQDWGRTNINDEALRDAELRRLKISISR